MNSSMSLLADIGGTHARFALTDGVSVLQARELKCADFPTIDAAISCYLQSVGGTTSLGRAALAIAAPLFGDQVTMTNHHWSFSVSELRQRFSLQKLIVLNDFTALAMSLLHLPQNELRQVEGVANSDRTPIALLGAGTGLGVSGLIPSGDQWLPLQGEGGHVSLAPGTKRELAVLDVLWTRFDHVSAERVLSGPGLENLYSAVCELEAVSVQPYSAADITERGMNGRCQLCAEALQLFCGLLGSVAGNLVLTLGATRGLYIGGGIVPRLGEYFLRSNFRSRFEGKGRYVNYLKPVPVYLINSPQPALVGLIQSLSSPSPRVEASE